MSSHPKHIYEWRMAAHVPVLILLQVLFIILFGTFVVYDPNSALHNAQSTEKAKDLIAGYPMFQDVNVMIFVGFGFLMTFLKKYGLSSLSLTMLCAAVCLQWATLVIGFFHLHKAKHMEELPDGTKTAVEDGGPGVIYMNMFDSMLLTEFATATVLISFGVVIGKTSPLQLIVMALIEIVLFVVNEIIGRKYLGAVDAGDTIFVHVFGAYFGLSASRVLYSKKYVENANQGSARTSDMFSMVGTLFLWMFWPSFNAAATVQGEPQHRAILNTYFSLCACIVSAFAFSAATNGNKKFVMEHIQNATLAGGVAIGACADLIVQPYGALIVGSIAGIMSTVGFQYISSFLIKRLKLHDTCGVNNLHGLPGIFGSMLSCIMAALATKEKYSDGLYVVYPALKESVAEDGTKIEAITNQQQALNQLFAFLVTLAIAVAGGSITGFIMRHIGNWQHWNANCYKGTTIMKLTDTTHSLTAAAVSTECEMPVEIYFNDNLFFEVNDDAEAPTHDGRNEKQQN